MTIYIDNAYKCHVSNDGTMRAIETDCFDGRCREFIEGFRYIPEGEVWTAEDGTKIAGLMIAPWKDYSELMYAQDKYLEGEVNSVMQDMADLIDEIYNEDLEVIG